MHFGVFSYSDYKTLTWKNLESVCRQEKFPGGSLFTASSLQYQETSVMSLQNCLNKPFWLVPFLYFLKEHKLRMEEHECILEDGKHPNSKIWKA